MNTLRFNQPNLRTIDTFLDSLLNNELPTQTQRNGAHFPAVNTIETDNDYQLELNVAGRKKEDFKISVDKNILTISFEKNEEKKDESKKYIRQEFILQSFRRTFSLDEKINVEGIDAKYDDGILLVTLPKKEEVKVLPKEISVK